MYYPDDIVEEVRSRNDIVDVISGYVKLQKKGSSYMGLCPFHSEKSPSFSVSGPKQIYHCFGCGVGGDVFKFIQEYENCSFQEAVKTLADRSGVKLPEMEYSQEDRRKADKKALLLEINKAAANYYYYQLRQPQGQAGYAYFRGRALTDATMKRFGLGFANKTGNTLYRYLRSKGYTDEALKDSGLVTMEERGTYDKFWNRVMFPIMDINNRVIGFGGRVMGDAKPKYLNSPETLVFDKSRNLYGLNYARKSREKYMLLCEGYMDVIAMQQAGFANAVASLGTAFTQQQAVLLKRYVNQVILTYDSDGAGVKAALRAIPILKEAGISARVLNMRPHKDPDEFIKNEGMEAFQERIEKARNSFLFEIDVLKKDYDINDPEQKTNFYNAVAGKLLEFPEALERDNYTQAVAREHQIPYEDLKRLVNSLGRMAGPRPAVSRIYENTAGERPNPAKKKDKDDGIRRSQRLLLTWMIERPELFDKLAGVIGPEDFVEPVYGKAAALVFEQQRSGKLNPAAVLNHFRDDDAACREIAELFDTSLQEPLKEDELKKAFSETVYRVKKHSLDVKSRSANNMEELQQIIREQAKLKNKVFTFD